MSGFAPPRPNPSVTFPRRAHNPVLRAVDWATLPSKLLTPSGAKLKLHFS